MITPRAKATLFSRLRSPGHHGRADERRARRARAAGEGRLTAMAGFKYLIEPMPSVTCATRRALAPLVMLGLLPPGDHERGPVTRRRAAAMSRAGQTTFRNRYL
jgi:hypothetical protein